MVVGKLNRVAIVLIGALLFVTTVGPTIAPATAPALAADPILLARHPAPSPDGRSIAFSYQGDLWTVARQGGEARRLTAHAAYDAHPIWSPDGKWIAFASDRDGNDDVYAIPVEAGDIQRLTWHSGADVPTGWTSDSRAVLFQSTRHVRDGNTPGAWVAPLEGGAAWPILPTGARSAVLSPDGSKLAYIRGGVFWWWRNYSGNGRHRLWLHEPTTPLTGDWWRAGAEGTPRDAPDVEGDDAVATGPGLHAQCALRADGRVTNLSDFTAPGSLVPDPQMTGVPQWLPDGRHLLYLREKNGASNLCVLSIADGSRWLITRFTDGRLRHPRLSANGAVATFEYESDLYVVAAPTGEELRSGQKAEAPQKLVITLPRDSNAASVVRVAVKGNATEFAVSEDGEQLAFVHEGELFAMKSEKDETYATRLTSSAARDQSPVWLDDSKGLIYVSDRDGNRDLYLLRSTDEKEPRLARTLSVEITPLTRTPAEESRPLLSPDGRRLLFQRGIGALVLVKLEDGKTTNERVLVDGWTDLAYDWSPDGKWIVYSQSDEDSNSEIWIEPVDGSREPFNVTQRPGNDTAPTWSSDGKLIAFVSERQVRNEVDLWYVRLQREDEELSRIDRLDAMSKRDLSDEEEKPRKKSGSAKDEKDKGEDNGGKADSAVVEVKIDFDDLPLRVRKLTSLPGQERDVLIGKDSAEFFFTGDTDGKRDLWKVKWDGTELERLTKAGVEPSQVRWDAKQKKLFFLESGGSIASVGTDGGEVTSYPFESEMTLDRVARRGYVFDEAWRELGARFYDEKMHGVDWPRMREHYRPWALAASTHRDFQDVVRMMIGELNSSHQNFSGGTSEYVMPTLVAETGELGSLFDAGFEGPGLRVARVVRRTPADREESRLHPGDVVLQINGAAIEGADGLARLLDRTVDQKVRLTVLGADGKRREVTIRPAKTSDFSARLYEEEIEAREELVHARSEGRVGYCHLTAMGVGNLETYERDLYRRARGRDALVIDVRDNSGGWITDYLLTSLMAPSHATTVERNGARGYPQDRRLIYAWTKPIVVLCDENTFSNGEIFAWAVQVIGRGPVVGQRTYGGVISTGGTTLADGSSLRLPLRGWYSRKDDIPLEGTGCEPDIVVVNRPDELARGIDRQLERSVEVALDQLR